MYSSAGGDFVTTCYLVRNGTFAREHAVHATFTGVYE